MKKFIYLCLVCMCAIIPMNVSAEEFYSKEEKFVIEEVNLTCSDFNGSENFLGLDKDYNYIFTVGINNKLEYYKVTKDGCTLMTDKQEILDFLNMPSYPQLVFTGPTGLDIYEETNYPIFSKTYQTVDVTATRPTSATIDTTKYTYYTSSNMGELTEEPNPTSENILDYFIIVADNYGFTSDYLTTLDDTIFGNVLQTQTPIFATRTPNNTMYYVFQDNNFVTYTYDVNGNLISSLNGSSPFALNEYLFLAYDSNNNYVIADKNEVVYDLNSDTIWLLGNNNKTTYINDNNSFYEITHIPTPYITNADTNDNIIVYFVMFIISFAVLFVPMLKKEKVNK